MTAADYFCTKCNDLMDAAKRCGACYRCSKCCKCHDDIPNVRTGEYDDEYLAKFEERRRKRS